MKCYLFDCRKFVNTYNTQYWLNPSKLFEYCTGIEKFNTQNDTSFFLNIKVFTHFCIYGNDKKKYSNAHMKHTTIVNNNPCLVRTYCKFLKTSLWEGERKMQEAERIRTSETQQCRRKVWKSWGASSNGKLTFVCVQLAGWCHQPASWK